MVEYNEKIVNAIIYDYHNLKTSWLITEGLINVWDIEMVIDKLNKEENELFLFLINHEEINDIANFYSLSEKAIYKRRKNLIKKFIELLNS